MSNYKLTLSGSEIDKVLSEVKTVDLNNIDRIGLAGDSYTEGMYYIKGKAWVCRFSELIDYNVESIGLGGATCQDLATNIKNNSPRFGSTLGWQDFKPTKAMLMSFVNDMATGSTNSETFLTGMKELISTVKEYGAEPIVCTEFRRVWGTGLESGLASACYDLGVKFWNILDYTEFLGHGNSTDGSPYKAEYWQGSHPGTRTGFIILDQYLREAKKLERPLRSLKIFRKIPSVVVGTVSDLVYETNFGRMKLFKEISIGHSHLTDPTKYDEINTYTTRTDSPSEYLALMSGGSVAISDYAVVECVLPTTRQKLSKVKLNINDSTASVYILKSGVWTLITNGETSELDGCLDYDKVKFLVYKSGGFNLTSISVDWFGVEGKERNIFNEFREFNRGTELLTNLFFVNNTGRTVTGDLTPKVSNDGVYPIGCTSIIEVTDNNYFEQNIPNADTHKSIKKICKVRIAARYNPATATADINEFSFDWADLSVEIKGQLSGGTTTTYFKTIKKVGLHWTMVEIDIDLPFGTSTQILRVVGTEKPIELSYISVVQS